MGKFVITEDEKKRIMGLYEQQAYNGGEGKLDSQIGDPKNPEPGDAVKYIQKKLNWGVDDTMKDYGKIYIFNGKTVDTSNSVITINREPSGKNFYIEVRKQGKPTKKFNDVFSVKLYDSVIDYVMK